MRRTVKLFASSGSLSEKPPLSLVSVPIVVPVTVTWAAGTGTLSAASVTWPVSRLGVCARRLVLTVPSTNIKPTDRTINRFMPLLLRNDHEPDHATFRVRDVHQV